MRKAEPFGSVFVFCGIMPLVGSSGLEPPTSRLSGVRSNHLSYEPISAAELLASCLRPALFCFPGSHLFRVRTRFDFRLTSYALCLRFQTAGGDERVRTDDPLLAKQVLSQLSYTPIFTLNTGRCSPFHFPNESPICIGPSKLNNTFDFLVIFRPWMKESALASLFFSIERR